MERAYTVNPESYERVRELALARREQVEAKATAGQVGSWGDEVTPWQQSA